MKPALQRPLSSNGEAEEADDAEGELGDDEGDAELGLVDASVAPGHPDDPPVIERARGDQGEGDPDDGSDVCQALPVKNGS